MAEQFELTLTELGLEIAFRKSVRLDEIEPTTRTAYISAWDMARVKGFTQIARIWNYIPQINRIEDGIENYQRFCAGRKNAYENLQMKNLDFPAASAVGSSDSQIRFKFLFSKKKPLQISNRLQVEAYQYPPDHGPTPPSFSRASVVDSALFLSGTASIRGHETMHSGDLTAQLNCTLENIDEVLKEAQKKTALNLDKTEMVWRVYIRELHFQELIEASLSGVLGPRIEFVPADICRKDLLVEIEGIFSGI